MSTVAFIIPTTGRPELARALDSVRAQSDPGWEAVVCGDGFYPVDQREPTIDYRDARVHALRGPNVASAGLTRAYALATAVNNLTPAWFGFLDDDDTISPEYVSRLGEIDSRSVDLVVFRMFHNELGVLPRPAEPSLTWGQVGISFAVSKPFLLRTHLNFLEEHDPYNPILGEAFNEDIDFLRRASLAGARVLLHPSVAYFVRDARPTVGAHA